MFTYTVPKFPYVYPSTRVPKVSTEWHTLLTLDDRDMSKFLLDIFRYAEFSSSRHTFDEMMQLGNALCASGKLYKDAIAISWLSQNPTARRLELASAFLAGFWEANGHDEAVSHEAVEAFLSLCNRVRSSDEASCGSIFALTKVILRDIPPALKTRVISTLRAAAEEHSVQTSSGGIANALLKKMHGACVLSKAIEARS